MDTEESKLPTLYMFSGLPGTGKTTLAQRLAQLLNAVYLRIDTIEQTLKDSGMSDVHEEGYLLGYALASDNLRLGMSVVSDSCNPIELTRHAWEQVAIDAQANFVNIEIVCSDARKHRSRIETRKSTVPGLLLPTWSEVMNREYHEWTVKRIIVDTAIRSEQECIDYLLFLTHEVRDRT